ncbi:MAG: ribonuclease HII [Fusobacterium gastrosuis]|uniref:ribonuclease HII n=1 Tax=Fusobacterium TaxID=848 RepID=UPI0025BA887F|nr:ribonuclease HII [Fusobacterium sp.]MCI7223867.1 ribonuclease HII [Fusobacterium sp.]MDD7391999.1 ribonuclease HII [Fusobacteriaceae bacterium]MDY5795561.1 ribonuclease HII [Fusobacterium gastrosuis]
MSNNSLYLFDLDFKEVIGVDEAGRGPLAGPVVAAAVKLKKYSEVLDEINDSKKLTEKKREKLYDIIVENFEIGVGVVSAIEIDEVNILNATFLAMRKALCELQDKLKDYERNIVLVDGNFKIREYKGEQVPIVKGDAKSLSIAAASIIAKVTRDRMMRELDKVYPNYDFSKHKGYGTKKHVEVLKKMGPIKGIHRNSFLGKIL